MDTNKIVLLSAFIELGFCEPVSLSQIATYFDVDDNNLQRYADDFEGLEMRCYLDNYDEDEESYTLCRDGLSWILHKEALILDNGKDDNISLYPVPQTDDNQENIEDAAPEEPDDPQPDPKTKEKAIYNTLYDQLMDIDDDMAFLDVIKEALDKVESKKYNIKYLSEVFTRLLADDKRHIIWETIQKAGIEDDSKLSVTLFLYMLTQLVLCNETKISWLQLTNTILKSSYCFPIRRGLFHEQHELLENGILQLEEEGQTQDNLYYLDKGIISALSCVYPTIKIMQANPLFKQLILHDNIQEKQLFFNKKEDKKIQQLMQLLDQKNFANVQERMEQNGLRKGFSSILYGAPGTGKTESVYQIARQTGRDIFPVEIAGQRSKYIGESEINFKKIFNDYRQMCEGSKVMPILFFNEADGIFGKRITEIDQSSDKVMNTLQNILLQELENLDGILIATTNLLGSLDKAFERRFFYKIELSKPDVEVRKALWHSMLPSLSDAFVNELVENFDFSGGQIENIARKRIVNMVITGIEPSQEDYWIMCQGELFGEKTVHRSIGYNAA